VPVERKFLSQIRDAEAARAKHALDAVVTDEFRAVF
jgi:hypothetical protein